MIEYLLEPGFAGTIGRTTAESTPWWPEPVRPDAGAPNVVMIVLDDVGFAQLGCYGSDIATPRIDGLAAEGIRYSNFHVTPLCSPTRACLLTGRNHHSVGMGMIAGFPSGYPSGREAVSHKAAMVSAIMADAGYSTYAVGKWHLCPMADMTPAGRFDHWPLAHGFDRFYGFLGGETDQYRPNLYVDNHLTLPPPVAGYHLSEDLVDQATAMISGHRSAAPDRPFFLYLAFGACHGPHQVPEPYRSRYRGRYHHGWDVTREQWHRRQLELGVIPPGTPLAPLNPDVAPWEALTPDDQERMARFHEVYAGFLEHTDVQVGRFLDALDRLGCSDDTMVMVLSDNGAAGEGGSRGSWNELIPFNGLTDDEAALLEGDHDLGAVDTYPLYPRGWAAAGNTPLKWYKHHTFGGGVRAPLIVRWPGHIARPGTIRRSFRHAVDITPTILEAADLTMPDSVRGVAQLPLHGVGFLSDIVGDTDHPAPTQRTQYFEMEGHRGLFHEGWKAVTKHEAGTSFDQDRWELYHLDEDFSEVNDLSETEPARMTMMRELWWLEAGRNGVLPLDDRFLERAQSRHGTDHEGRTRYEYFRGTARIAESAAAEVRSGQFSVRTTLNDLESHHAGVLVSFGGRFSGFVLYVRDGVLCLDYNSYGDLTSVRSAPLPSGKCDVEMVWRSHENRAKVELKVDDRVSTSATIDRPVPYYAGGNGFEIGGNWLSPVSSHYTPPFEFTGSFTSVVIEARPESVDVTQARDVAARAD
jgi:arylsulfatase A-like enzyme